MTEVTKERVEELREYVRTGRLLVTGDPADVSALINAIDDYAKVKAENFKLKANDLRFYEGKAEAMELRAEKAEAELEKVNAALDKTLQQVTNLDGQIDYLEAQLAKQAPLIEAAEELSYVAGLRGDDELPHPSNDSKMWTARMQTAWDDLRAALKLREEKK